MKLPVPRSLLLLFVVQIGDTSCPSSTLFKFSHPLDLPLQRLGHLNPCNITYLAHASHPFCRSTSTPCSNRDGQKAGAIEISGTREGTTCSVMRCGTGQRGYQSRHRCRCSLTGVVSFHLPLGHHEREKGKNIVTCVSVLLLSSPSSISSSHLTFIRPRGCDDTVSACRRRVVPGFLRELFIRSRITSVVRGHRIR